MLLCSGDIQWHATLLHWWFGLVFRLLVLKNGSVLNTRHHTWKHFLTNNPIEWGFTADTGHKHQIPQSAWTRSLRLKFSHMKLQHTLPAIATMCNSQLQLLLFFFLLFLLFEEGLECTLTSSAAQSENHNNQTRLTFGPEFTKIG